MIVYHSQVNYTYSISPTILNFLILVALLWSAHSTANEPEAQHTPPPQHTLDVHKLDAEAALNKSGQAIDRFVTRRILRKKDEDFSDASANARVTLETGYFEGGTFTSDIDFDISFVLPTAKEHVRLFAGGKKSDFKNGKSTARNNTEDRLENTDAQAGLQYSFDAIKSWNPRLRGGVKFKKSKLAPFTELQFKRRFGSESEHIWLTQAGRYSRFERMVYTTNADYFHSINPSWDFRFANQFRYQQPKHHWTYQHSPILTYSFSKQGRWINQLTISGEEDQKKIYTQATISTRLIHPIFRPWILLELEPVHTHSLINNNHDNALFLRTHFLFNR